MVTNFQINLTKHTRSMQLIKNIIKSKDKILYFIILFFIAPLSIANHCGSYQEKRSKIWATTSTIYHKALPNSDHPGILTQDKKKIFENFWKHFSFIQ